MSPATPERRRAAPDTLGTLDTPGAPPPSAARRDIILALDIGSKKTGLAIGNRITGGARPLEIVRGDRQRQLAAIARTIADWQPALMVVGLPLHMDGSEHRVTAQVRRFAAALARRFALPVVYADERRSTELARRQRRVGDIDDSAAAIILQNWLDRNPDAAQSAAAAR